MADALPVKIPCGSIFIYGDLSLPKEAKGLVIFAHGAGSSRFSPRNRYVAGVLNKSGFATLLMDLLTQEEEDLENQGAMRRFDIGLLAERLLAGTEWALKHFVKQPLPLGYFGASTGAAAALVAASRKPDSIKAVVSRGGRPDLAYQALRHVQAPTLLIVGGYDLDVLQLNEKALELLSSPTKKITIVPRATHLFEEEGALEQVAKLATQWFTDYLKKF